MKGKARRLLSWVCVLALCMSLLPVTALAAGDGSSTTTVAKGSVTESQNGVTVNKSVSQNANGSYQLTMEAYASNVVTTESKTTPLDIVLVLDQSGSMADTFSGNQTRQAAMKTAVKNFIDSVAKQYSDESNHQMAIVTFDNNASALADWTAVNSQGKNELERDIDNLASRPEGATNVAAGMEEAQDLLEDKTGNNDRQQVVIVFTDGVPTTSNEFNTSVANQALTIAKGLKDDGVSIYTIGIFAGANPSELYGASGFDTNSDGTVNSSWKIDEWGFFPGTDFPEADRPAANRFLNYLSSNYSDAAEIGLRRDTEGLGIFHSAITYTITRNFTYSNDGYYLTAENSEGLNVVFQKIFDEINSLQVYPDETAVLTDTLSQYFNFPSELADGSVEVGSDVTAQYVPVESIDGDNITWGTAEKLPDGTNLEVTVEGDTINIKGFDYVKNAVTQKEDGITGGKLVVSFPIELDEAACVADTSITNDQYPTNSIEEDSRAGLEYKENKDAEANNASTLLDKSPTVYYDKESYDANGTDVTVQVYVDGIPVMDPYNYVSLFRNSGNTSYTYWKATLDSDSGIITCDFDYYTGEGYDCVDIDVTLTNQAYVLQGIQSFQSYGSSGTKNVTPGTNKWTIDNVTAVGNENDPDVKIYLRTKYNVKYYVDGTESTTIQDNGVYIENEDVKTTSTDADKPETGENTWMSWKDTDLKTSITVKELPQNTQTEVYSGWWLNDSAMTGEPIVPNTSIAVSNAKPEGTTITFYGQANTPTADYTVKYEFLGENGEIDGSVTINDNDWNEDTSFPEGGDAEVGGTAEVSPSNTVTKTDGDNYVLVSTNHSCTIDVDSSKNVITVTYALDNWKDSEDGDTETGGDGTPDYQQALIKYVSNENGSVAPQLDVVTLTTTDGNNKYSGNVTADSTATPNDNYAFDYWTKDSNDDWKGWDSELNDPFTAQGGQTYTYTANFAKDTNKDDIPDKYQVFVNFVSADEDRGEVSTKDDAKDNTGINQVYTLKDEDGHYATKGDVTPSLAGVDVKANEGFAFDIWTKDDGTDEVNPEALLGAVKGGTTITFYARFTAVENVTVNKELVKVNNENYDGTSKVNSGDVLTYQITVQNTGGADATNGGNPFVLADTMWKDGAPDNYQVTFTDANGNSQDLTGIYTIEGDSVKIGAIPARSQYVFTYTYTVQQSDEGKTLENTATLAYNAEETIEDTVEVDVEKTHCIITYEYQSGSAGMELPTEAEDFPPVPESQTLKIGDTVQLPTPETIQVRVEGGVWIFLGWYNDEGLLNPPIIARDDMTIIGLWVFNEAYTLTYDANGGDVGSVPTDSTAYTEGQTATLSTESKPTHAQAPTPEGSVITDKELVDVVFIGWSTTQTDKIFAAGEDYGDIVTRVTFQDQDITVYAVWGYDENGDGIADAQQIVITPADITIYTGGQSYDGIVEGENGEIAENNGMPEPGFYFILPYELDNELGGRGNTEDLTGKLRLHYENGDDIRTWDLALYNEEAGTANKVYGKYYIYRLKPVNNNDLVVRVEIQDGDRLVTSDQFDISLNGELYKEYTMTLYTNSVEQNRVTAQTNVDGTGTDWTPRDTQGIALGTGTLTIRGTNDEEPVSEILDNVTAPVEEITAKAAEGTKYTINDSNLPVVNQDAVQLLNDSLVEGSTDALKEAIVDEATTDDSVTITEDYQFDFCYLDLVDTSNGNAYATTNQPLEIYWPYPDGTNQDTTFYIAHFDGLDREFDPNNLENELNGAELKIYSANTDNSDLKLENTEQGIKISTSTFSPFVLVYNQKDAAAPSLTVDKELTAVNGKAPGSSVSVGDTLTYTITVKNNGNVDLTNVSVKDTFNGKGTLNFAASSDYTVTNNNDGTYTITLNSNLAVDNSVKITATYKVLRGDANGTLTNAVSVTGTPTDGGEPTTGGDTETTPVNPYHPPIRPPVDPDKPELNTEDHYAYIVGYEDGSVQPEGDITRAEVATIFFRLLTDESRNEYWSQTNPYSDVSADDWFNNAVSTLTNAGVLDGYEDGTFKPNGNITRAEFATITARFFEATYDGENLFPDIEGHWAQDYINEAANAGIVNGYEDGTFRPQQYITRAEAVTMVNRTIERHPDADHLLDDMITWPDNPETAWYYEQIQEATNSHEYTMNTDDEQNPYEIWTKLLPNRDWSELEKEWSDANDGAGSGEVV